MLHELGYQLAPDQQSLTPLQRQFLVEAFKVRYEKAAK